MGKKIGVFKMEQQAIEAVELLEKEGFSAGELQVLARDSDHTHRIEAETDVPTQEVQEIAENNDGGVVGIPLAVGGMGVGNPGGSTAAGNTYGAAPAVGAGFFGGLFRRDFRSDDNDGIRDALRTLGLGSKEADSARDAIREGSLLIVVDLEDDAEKTDSGINRLDKAEAVFRSSGAIDIH
ncbi:general stress protein [Paenibacillus daejeonensis]|uniref:general stress protein n=1 Tax=Paenibacillus daejeonensis TaxID=135193 RepID=UPI0003772D41|nr:general stress protein [Paenibacillus daejeonensis]